MAKIVDCLLLFLVISISNEYAFAAETDEIVRTVEEIQSVYRSPEPTGFAYLAESFDDAGRFETTWIRSEAKKEGVDEDLAKYDGTWSLEQPKKNPEDGNLGLVLKSKARHAAIATVLSKTFHFEDKPLIVQYEVTFQEDQECGGAYIKLLTLHENHQDLRTFHDKTPYTIMFGPDKCGTDTQLHFIFRHKNPLNGTFEEKQCKKPKDKLEEIFKDKQPHLFTLIVRPNNMFQIKVDNKIVNEGSLLDDFTPPVNPPLEIEDPNDKRPADWDDREKIPDPSAVKPDEWDEDAPAQILDEDDIMPEGWLENEPSTIPNPESVKPEDWDVEMDGEWEPPEIANPKCADAPGCGPYKQKMKNNPRYKGKWLPPLINNPNYKGKWKPRLIHNPHYFRDDHPFRMAPIYAVGFELWSVSPDIYFDNIIITDDESVAEKWAEDSFEIRQKKIAAENETFWGRMMSSLNHRPGWWALYFIYCTIPVVLYVYFLVKRYKEWNLWYTIAKFTAERPWMWAIYIMALAIPVLLIFYCCCFVSEDKEDSKEEENLHVHEDWSKEPNKEEENKEEEPDNTNTEEGKEKVEEEDVQEEEQVSETTTLLESDKEFTIIDHSPLAEKEGPRRRKPNKE